MPELRIYNAPFHGYLLWEGKMANKDLLRESFSPPKRGNMADLEFTEKTKKKFPQHRVEHLFPRKQSSFYDHTNRSSPQSDFHDAMSGIKQGIERLSKKEKLVLVSGDHLTLLGLVGGLIEKNLKKFGILSVDKHLDKAVLQKMEIPDPGSVMTALKRDFKIKGESIFPFGLVTPPKGILEESFIPTENITFGEDLDKEDAIKNAVRKIKKSGLKKIIFDVDVDGLHPKYGDAHYYKSPQRDDFNPDGVVTQEHLIELMNTLKKRGIGIMALHVSGYEPLKDRIFNEKNPKTAKVIWNLIREFGK